MRITIFLLIVGFCLVSSKYLSYEADDSNTLLRIKRSDESSDSSSSVEQNKDSSENDDSDDDDDDAIEKDVKQHNLDDKMKRKALERQEKEKRKKDEEQRKLEEKLAKAQRKQEEKREKEERKRIERLEKEKLKEEEHLIKEERKKQEKQRKELEKLEKEATQIKPVDNDFLETEEESSVELKDVWKEHIYVKYGLTLASTKLEKQAALNRYLQEELGLHQNSTEQERFQAVTQLIQNKLQTDVAARTAIKNQLLSHINAVAIQKWRADIAKDLEELNNKTDILNNVSLPWVPLAKQQIEERRSFLQTISQFLSSILPNWITGGSNVQNPIKDGDNSASAANKPDNSVLNEPSTGILESNLDTGISDSTVTASQSNNNDAAGSHIPPLSAGTNPPAQGSSAIPAESTGERVENIKCPSTNTVISEDSASSVNGDISSAVVATAVNNNNNVEGSVNVANIPSTTVTDKDAPVDNTVIPSVNANEFTISSTNNEITSLPGTNVNSGVPSATVNDNGETSVGTESLNNIPLINNVLANPDETQHSKIDEVTLGNSGNDDSLSLTDSIVPDNPDTSSNNNINVPTVSIVDTSSALSPDVVLSETNDATLNSNNSGDLASTVADDVARPILISQEDEVTSEIVANAVSPGITETSLDTSVVSTIGSDVTLGNDANVLLPTIITNEAHSVTLEAASSGNNNLAAATNNENPIIPPVIFAEGNDGSSDAKDNSPTTSDEGLIANSGSETSEASEGISIDNSILQSVTLDDNAPSVDPNSVTDGSSDTTTINNVDNPSPNVPLDIASSGNSNVASTSIDMENPTSNVANNIVIQTPEVSVEGNQPGSVNSVIADSSSITAGVLGENPSFGTLEGVENISIDNSNLPSISLTGDASPVEPNNISIGSGDSNSINNAENPSPSVLIDVASSGNSDVSSTPIKSEMPTSNVGNNDIDTTPVVTVEGNEPALDNSATADSSSINDGVLSENPSLGISEDSENISTNNPNLSSTSISNNTPPINDDIVSIGSSDTTATNDVGNPSSSVADDDKLPSSNVVYAEGNYVESGITDTVTTPVVIGLPLDVVFSSVSESSPAADPGSISPSSSSTVSVNDDVILSNVADDTLPANNIIEITAVDESANSVDVSSNRIDIINVAPENTNTTEANIISSESTSPAIPVEIENSAIGSSNIDNNTNTFEAAPAGIPDTNIDVNANNADSTIAPDIIISVKTQDEEVDTNSETVSIVTVNPIESAKGNEGVTTDSDIINNVSTVSASATETSEPSETPQSSQSSVVDGVTPAELPAPLVKGPLVKGPPVKGPLVIIDGITIPDESGASVVEILRQ